MNIERIELSNFGSWAEVDVPIEGGVTLISGPNGAGKSTLLSAIEFALYGATSDAGRLIRRGTDRAHVKVTVGTDEGRLHVMRSIQRSGSSARVALSLGHEATTEGEVDLLNAATTTETQALLDDLLGVSREVLLASAFSTQHGGAAFTEAKPAERKRVFAEILALGMWDRLHEDAKAEQRDARAIAAAAQVRADQLAGAGDRLLRAQEDEFAAHERKKGAAEAERNAEAEATRLAAEAEDAREARRQHAAAVEAAERARADHERATAERSVADASLQRAKDATANAPSVPDASAALEAAMYELGEAQERHEHALDAHVRWRDEFSAATRTRQDLLDEDDTGNCARCGQPLHADVTERLDAATVAVREFAASQPDLLGPENALAAARSAALAAQTRLAEAETIQALAGSTDAAESRATDAVMYQRKAAHRLAQADGALADAAAVVAKTPAVEIEYQQAMTAVEQARLAHRTAAAELARAEAAAQHAEREANEEQAAREALAAAQHDEAIASILAAGFGPTGVPSLIIDNVLGQLADEANRVLSELGTPIRVDLRSQRVTKDNRLVDALDIIVLDATDEAPYETLSGGERTRVALALRAALTRLLAAKSGARVRLLVVDEPSGLDAAGAEAFADVLQSFTAAGIFETALIVTHDERLADRIDRVIRIEKSAGGVSRMADSAPQFPAEHGSSSGGDRPAPSGARMGATNA